MSFNDFFLQFYLLRLIPSDVVLCSIGTGSRFNAANRLGSLLAHFVDVNNLLSVAVRTVYEHLMGFQFASSGAMTLICDMQVTYLPQYKEFIWKYVFFYRRYIKNRRFLTM